MKRVLVVDDAKSIRTLLAKSLENSGFLVKTAENGKEALEVLLSESFDLVFLDIKLPIISGTEVLRRIRDKGVETPVVVITAFGNIKNAVDCTRMGAVAYVQKPFTANRINSVLDELNISGKEECPDLSQINCLMDNNEFEAVFELLKGALAKNPLDREIYYMLAETSERLNRPEDAEKYRRLYEAIGGR